MFGNWKYKYIDRAYRPGGYYMRRHKARSKARMFGIKRHILKQKEGDARLANFRRIGKRVLWNNRMMRRFKRSRARVAIQRLREQNAREAARLHRAVNSMHRAGLFNH